MRKNFNEAQAAGYLLQIASAIEFLHNKGIAHRDLKPENILFATEKGKTQNETIKVCDFGLAKHFDTEAQNLKTMAGSMQYMAPEIINKKHGGGYGQEVDIWSLGVLTYVLLCGYSPF
eukprot:UN33207